MLVVETWNLLEQREDPDQVAKGADGQHVGVNRLHKVVHHPVLDHVKTLAESEIAHDVEAVKVEHCRRIERQPLHLFQLFEEQVRVLCDSGLVISEGLKSR